VAVSAAPPGDTVIVRAGEYMGFDVRVVGSASAPVLFLDEPFNGIDTVTSRQIKDLLRERVAAGATILFSSHVMEVVEKLCSGLAIIHHGRIVFAETMERLRARPDFSSLEDAFIAAVGREELIHAEDQSWLAG